MKNIWYLDEAYGAVNLAHAALIELPFQSEYGNLGVSFRADPGCLAHTTIVVPPDVPSRRFLFELLRLAEKLPEHSIIQLSDVLRELGKDVLRELGKDVEFCLSGQKPEPPPSRLIKEGAYKAP